MICNRGGRGERKVICHGLNGFSQNPMKLKAAQFCVLRASSVFLVVNSLLAKSPRRKEFRIVEGAEGARPTANSF